MILGSIYINNNAVITHRDSYVLNNLSVISVRRPFLGSAFLLGTAFSGFVCSFSDLLYQNEIITIISISAASMVAGWNVGQLKLLSRDLRGSELSGAIWGSFSDLNLTRTKIVMQLSKIDEGENK
uniref:Uncharacterized protein n=1 Tax=OCS116 cluster bacterium TaxID=2030921 RepID=A0A2A4Z3B5_9PROT